jgi:hypothetical protein
MTSKRMIHELRNTSWMISDDHKEIIVNTTTKFILSSSYPFTCPTLMIHNHSHIDLLKKNMFKYTDFCNVCHIDIPCICCWSITSRWSPCYTCKDVYQEYMIFNKKIVYVNVLYQLYQQRIPDIIIKEISNYLL